MWQYLDFAPSAPLWRHKSNDYGISHGLPLQVGSLPGLLPQTTAEGAGEAVQVIPQEHLRLGALQTAHVEEILALRTLQREQPLFVIHGLATVMALPR